MDATGGVRQQFVMTEKRITIFPCRCKPPADGVARGDPIAALVSGVDPVHGIDHLKPEVVSAITSDLSDWPAQATRPDSE
jgi:hypothetical protein